MNTNLKSGWAYVSIPPPPLVIKKKIQKKNSKKKKEIRMGRVRDADKKLENYWRVSNEICNKIHYLLESRP